MTEETTTKPRLNLQDCRSQDLVSRLLAATPPYLYSAPTGPHSFFFSEMLRSLVQAKTNSDAAAMRNSAAQHQQQQSSGAPIPPHQNVLRRPRKRQWSQHRAPIFDPPPKKLIEEDKVEKPLELTKKHSAFSSPKQQTIDEKRLPPSPPMENLQKFQRLDSDSKAMPTPNTSCEHPTTSSPSMTTTPSSSSIRPGSDIALPPPPPMWYPPLYPPYGIDPLHFFIDLRVSGHIYDRKKDNQSPTYRPDNNNILQLDPEKLSKCRQNSAFSVPTPKDQSAMNLTSTSSTAIPAFHPKFESDFDYFDTKENKNSKNTNYVMQNLPRIYTNLTSQATSSPNNNIHHLHNSIGGSTARSTENNEQENNEKMERKFFAQHNEKVETITTTTSNNNNRVVVGVADEHDKFYGVNKFENGKGYKLEGDVGVVSDDDEPITIEEID